MKGEKVNKFNQDMFNELDGVIDKINNNQSIQWVLFDSLKPGVFIAGADIKELKSVSSPADGQALIERGQLLFNKIEKIRPQTVSLIDGVALGGGLEFSLACDYIVVTDSNRVKLGLPEVNLGIIPGWGGTQRLPKRVGLIKGIEYIVSGKTLNFKNALKFGLADAIVPSAFKHDALMDLIKTKKLKKTRSKTSLIELVPGVKLLIKRKVKKSILKKQKVIIQRLWLL